MVGFRAFALAVRLVGSQALNIIAGNATSSSSVLAFPYGHHLKRTLALRRSLISLCFLMSAPSHEYLSQFSSNVGLLSSAGEDGVPPRAVGGEEDLAVGGEEDLAA